MNVVRCAPDARRCERDATSAIDAAPSMIVGFAREPVYQRARAKLTSSSNTDVPRAARIGPSASTKSGSFVPALREPSHMSFVNARLFAKTCLRRCAKNIAPPYMDHVTYLSFLNGVQSGCAW